MIYVDQCRDISAWSSLMWLFLAIMAYMLMLGVVAGMEIQRQRSKR